jgi:hypothetical protein
MLSNEDEREDEDDWGGIAIKEKRADEDQMFAPLELDNRFTSLRKDSENAFDPCLMFLERYR